MQKPENDSIYLYDKTDAHAFSSIFNEISEICQWTMQEIKEIGLHIFTTQTSQFTREQLPGRQNSDWKQWQEMSQRDDNHSDITRFRHLQPYKISVKLNYNLEVTGL